MANTFSTTPSEVIKSEFALPGISETAQSALREALASSSAKLRLATPESALNLLRKGDPRVRGYFEYGLAHHIGDHLGALDNEVQAVYLYDDEATPEDVVHGQVPSTLIHLIIVAQRKTSALSSLLAALDRALVEAYAELMGKTQMAHLLDAQVVDAAEVAAHSGYGALLASLYHRPLSVWQR